MDDEDIRHWQALIHEYKRHLRILEGKVAVYGPLDSPAFLIKDIEDTKKIIGELEQRIRRRIRNADEGDKLYNTEEVDEIMEKISNIIHIEEDIRFFSIILELREKQIAEGQLSKDLFRHIQGESERLKEEIDGLKEELEQRKIQLSLFYRISED